MTKTEKVGVVIIYKDDELHGMIYNDTTKRNKVLYKCIPMSEDEMIEILEK